MSTASPSSPASSSARIEEVSLKLAGLLERAGYQMVFPPILQPLEVFLEYAGEDIRKRLFSVSDIAGGEYCLRPDLTIPCSRLYLAAPEKGGEQRLCYRGRAFRYHAADSSKPSEFPQVGAEYFGGGHAEDADAELMSLALSGLRAIGCDGFEVEMGDLRLFDALLDAVGNSGNREISFWCRELKRDFHQSERVFSRRLEQAGSPPEQRPNPPAARDALERLDDLPPDAPLGGRARDEIRARFLQRQERNSLPPLPENLCAALRQFLEIRAPFPQAMREMRALCDNIQVKMEPDMRRLERRGEMLRACGLEVESVLFATGFGRRLGYYTGFAFAFQRDGMQIAAGGRYDQLLQALGSAQAIPAVGYAARPDRIASLWPEAAANAAGDAP